MFAKSWDKMFILEISPGIPYPKEEDRWRRYGEPLSRLFAPYFSGNKLFEWFMDDSGNFLAGVNVACFESCSKWKESQNEQKDIELFLSLFAPIDDFFTKCGSRAAITGLFDIEVAKANVSGAARLLSGQLPVEFDEPETGKPMNMIKHNDRYYIIYTGKQTGCKRFRELSKEQAMEIAKADPNQFWQTLNDT